jgi:CubicO group peptidase (beta-lactamase class C family)
MLLLMVSATVRSPALAQTRPMTGAAVPEYASLDRCVLEFMDQIDCTAATAAVSRDGKLLYSRGYGWRDAHSKKPTTPDTLMRIAGITYNITAAAVRKLVREGKLALDTKAFQYLNLKPPRDANPDPRLEQITVGELLENRGGWDASTAFDPFTRLHDIQKSLRLSRRPRPVDVVRFMLREPLQFDPGSRMARSNFGYCVLGRLIEKASGKPYGVYIAEELFRPLGVDDVKLARNVARDPREVWYPVKEVPIEAMDSFAGLIASAPSLCKFLDAYWATGQPRRPGNDLQFTYVGAIAGSTAIIRQRSDGYNVAILFNNRRGDPTQEQDGRALEHSLDEAIDGFVSK